MDNLEGTVNGIEAALQKAGLFPIVEFRDGSQRDKPIGVGVRAPITIGEGDQRRTVRTVVAQIEMASKDGKPKTSWDIFYYHSAYVRTVRAVLNTITGDQVALTEHHNYQ